MAEPLKVRYVGDDWKLYDRTLNHGDIANLNFITYDETDEDGTFWIAINGASYPTSFAELISNWELV